MAGEQPSAFGAQLRRYREAAGLSQEELAERARLTAAAIGALERGERRRPYPHTVQLLATALDLDEAHRAALIAAVPRRGADQPRRPPTGAPSDTRARSDPTEDRRPVLNMPGVATARPPGSTAFVGRTDELASLQTALADVAAGRGRVVMVVGEAGIGKTRLAREFANAAQAEGATVLWGGCFEGDWQPPYGPWVEAIRGYTRGRPPEALRQDLGSGAAAIARLLPEIRAGLPDLPLTASLSPDEERYRLYDAVVQLLIAASVERPLVVVVDDVHWADADSLRLLQQVGRFVGRERVLVVGTYRDPEVGLTDEHPLLATLAALRREGEYQRVGLGGFNGEETDIYLAQMAGQALPQALVKAIEEETNGNPFYAREVFRHLTEEGKVLRRDGRWSTDLSIRELGIPEGVRQVVGHRVARLSHQTGEVLRVAAGFSGAFGYDVLEALSGLPADGLLDCLDEALRAGLIRASDETPPRYAFAHAIVRHTLYESLNPDRRARLHRRIAVALELVYAGHELEHSAELATQYHASVMIPDAGRGLRYALAVASQAKAAFAHERAAAFLRMARDLATDAPAGQQADILCRLAVAEAEAVRLDEARSVADEALIALQMAGAEPRARAEFLAIIARALKDGGARTEVWEPLVEQGLALAGDARDLVWARLALLRDHFESVQSGPISGGEWQGQDPEAVAVARNEGDEEDYAQTLEPLEWRTREETEAVLVLARTWSQPVAIMRALDAAGRDLGYRHGSFRDARPVYEELLAISERVGSIPGQAEALSHVATAQVATGDLAVGQETALRAYDVIARLGPGHRLHFVATGLAFVLAYFLDGEWPVLADATARYAISADTARSPVGIMAAAFGALSSGRAGDPAAARAMLGHFTSAVDHMAPRTYTQVTSVPIAATAVWDLEAAELAATYRRLVLDMLNAGVGDHLFGPLELWVARMSALLGDDGDAEDNFELARRKLDARGLTHLRGIVDYDQARTQLRSGPSDRVPIAKLLDAAAAAFRAHGMLGWAERAALEKERLSTVAGASTGSTPRAGKSRTSDRPAGLTAREQEVLGLVAAGLTNKEIAARLVLSVATVERHIANTYGKIGAGRRYDAIAYARSHDLGPDPEGHS